MTGRPGYRTMEMIGGSSAPYLACTPCFPLFCTLFTVGTKIIADPEKCFRELISEKLLILLRDRPCLELIIISSHFQAFLFLQKITEISLKAINSSKKVLKITGPALSRINSVILSARTVIGVETEALLDY